VAIRPLFREHDAMTAERAAQWDQRLTRLRTLRALFTRELRYARAVRAGLLVQRAYDRWASEAISCGRGT
jgi:hypothetical protein